MNDVCETFYYNARLPGAIKDDYRLTVKGKTRAFNVINERSMKAISERAFKAFELMYYREANAIHGIDHKDVDGDMWAGICELSTAWKEPKTGASIFPEEFQPWEADSEAFIELVDYKYELTYIGEIAFNKYLNEAKKLFDRCITQLNVA